MDYTVLIFLRARNRKKTVYTGCLLNNRCHSRLIYCRWINAQHASDPVEYTLIECSCWFRSDDYRNLCNVNTQTLEIVCNNNQYLAFDIRRVEQTH